MEAQLIAARSGAAMAAFAPIARFAMDPRFAARDPSDPEVCDFTLGNPHDPVVPGFVAAIERQLTPRDPSWFAYQMGVPATIAAIAAGLRERLQLPFAKNEAMIERALPIFARSMQGHTDV